MPKIVIAATAISPEMTIEGANLMSLTAALSSTVSGAELVMDQCEPTVYANATINIGLFIPKNSSMLIDADGKIFWCGIDNYRLLEHLPVATPVYYYEGDNLIGKFYLRKVTRVAKEAYTLVCTSFLGLLETKIHKGGIYNGATFGSVLIEIMSQMSVIWQCPSEVSLTPVYGWLPYGNARENLHQLLLAQGVNILKDSDGTIVFDYLNATDPKVIDEDRLYMNSSVSYQEPATRSEVTEHKYMALTDDEEVTLYDNSDAQIAADHELVIFRDAPIHDLVGTGITVHESNCNYAIISGIGTLTGKIYTDQQRIISRGTDMTKTVSVTECTLVNSENSARLARRVLDYYASAKHVSGGFILDDEIPSDYVTITDAFGDTSNGMIDRMEITASVKTRADAEFVTGYVPHGGGNAFTHVDRITESGTWTVPEDVDIVRVVVIGGGQGGQGAEDGEDGHGGSDTLSYTSYDQTQIWVAWKSDVSQPLGGEAGEGGEGGTWSSADWDVTEGDTITITVGSGGSGGSSGGGAGSSGTASTAAYDGTTLTSEDGYETGYHDLIESAWYCIAGSDGTPGGNGGHNTSLYASGPAGNNVGYYLGGDGGKSAERRSGTRLLTGAGGGGGGAAVGGYGTKGGNGLQSSSSSSDGGDGGNGANASAPAQASYGCGGTGGNGGGAGGSAGLALLQDNVPMTAAGVSTGLAGSGGSGSSGGKGGDGIVLIYY